jgi:hypothetical protein
MRMMNVCMLKSMRMLNGLQPLVEFFWFSYSGGKTAASSISTDIIENFRRLHDWGRSQKQYLFPDRTTLLLTNGMNFVQDNSLDPWSPSAR